MKGQTCLIVGGTGGIGRVIAEQLLREQFRVIVHGRNSDKLKSLLAEYKETASIEALEQNFRTRSDIYDFRDKLDQFGKIDIAIVCFGPLISGSIANTSIEDCEYLIDMNLLLPTVVINALAPRMAEMKWGRIILFGGTGTDQIRGYTNIALYSAAKLGLNGLVRSSALEFAHANLRINILNLGYVETEYYSRVTVESLKKRTTVLDPLKIYDIIKFLISEKSDAINGMVINAGYI